MRPDLNLEQVKVKQQFCAAIGISLVAASEDCLRQHSNEEKNHKFSSKFGEHSAKKQPLF